MITQENFKKWSKIGLIGLAALVVAPVVFMIIKGIVGAAIALAVGGLVIALAPAVSQSLTTLKFKALGVVIDHSPVEALHQRAKERWEELENQQEMLKQQAASLESFRSKALRFIKQYPDEALTWQERLKGYENLFAMRVEMWKKARDSTQIFMQQVDKAEAIYEMAVEDQKIGKSFGKSKDFMSVFKEKTAFEAIDKANNQAMADLKMALLDDDFVTKKVEESVEPMRQVSYTNNTVNLGSLLEIRELQPAVLKGM